MIRYITDHLRRFFPVLLIPIGLGTLLAIAAPKDSAAFYFGVGFVLLILLFLLIQVISLMGNLRQCKQNGMLEAFLADYQKARPIDNGLRLGEHFLFANTDFAQYSSIRSLHASISREHNHNGGTQIFFDLHAGIAGGVTLNILRKRQSASVSAYDAERSFERVMDEIAAKNPDVRITPPKF